VLEFLGESSNLVGVLSDDCFGSITSGAVKDIAKVLVIREQASCEAEALRVVPLQLGIVAFLDLAQSCASSSTHEDCDLIDRSEMIDWPCSDAAIQVALKPYPHNVDAERPCDNGVSRFVESGSTTGAGIGIGAHGADLSRRSLARKSAVEFRISPCMELAERKPRLGGA
jgi:hypothetical protein